MRLASCIAALLCASAAPAFATGGLFCQPVSNPGAGPALRLVLSRGDAMAVIQAHLTQDGAAFSTGREGGAPAISQGWIDDRLLKLDIVDANAERRIARLDARRAGEDYVGTLMLDGRTWRVRCQESG